MISSGINLIMTVIGFAVSTMFIIFVCTRLIYARIQINRSRRSFHLASRSNLSILERGLNGVEPSVLANFPTKKYSDDSSAAKDTQCVVCLVDYHEDDMLRILPSCGHSFHTTCIDIWLQQQSTCPVCRTSLRNYPERKWFMQPLFSSAIRSQYSSESFDSHSFPSHRLSPRSHNNPGINSIEEDHFISQNDEAETEVNVHGESENEHITKGAGNKHIESPSSIENNSM